MINQDSNNSILRTNIVSKSVGGKKTKTLKKRKGGGLFDSFFGQDACIAEKNNLISKKKIYKKDAERAIKQLREEYQKLLRKLQIDTNNRCQEYTKSQKEMLKLQQKTQNKPSIFKKTLKYLGGIKNLKKEIENQHQLFNKNLYYQVKYLYKYGGGDTDYCVSIIKEYQEKVAALKEQFETLIGEYAQKNYTEPLQEARNLYNQCAIKHNEGEVDIPKPIRPTVPATAESEKIDTETKSLLSSLLSGPEYVDGKIKRPQIIVPPEQQKPQNEVDYATSILQKKTEEMRKLREAYKEFSPQQQQKQAEEKINFNGKDYTREDVKKMTQQEKDVLRKQIDDAISKENDTQRKNKLNQLKGWAK